MTLEHNGYSYQFYTTRTGYCAVRSDGARTVRKYTTINGVIRAIKRGTAEFIKTA